jgi:hypothetical protein
MVPVTTSVCAGAAVAASESAPAMANVNLNMEFPRRDRCTETLQIDHASGNRLCANEIRIFSHYSARKIKKAEEFPPPFLASREALSACCR